MTVLTIEWLSGALAIVSSAILAVAILPDRPLRPFHVCFSLGVLAFATEALAALMLAPRGPWDADIPFLSWVLRLAMLLTPLVWVGVRVAFLFPRGSCRPLVR